MEGEEMTSLLSRVYEAQNRVQDRDLGSEEVISSVLSEVAVYLEENEFVKTEDQLPTFRHDDWDYDSVGVIGVLKSESGTRYVKPVYYERTKIRGKRVERWKDWYGRLLQGYEVTHWRKFPALPVESKEYGVKMGSED